MNEKLKPCPFCGGTVTIRLDGIIDSPKDWWEITGNASLCTCKCGISMRSKIFTYGRKGYEGEREKKELIEKWNRGMKDDKANLDCSM